MVTITDQERVEKEDKKRTLVMNEIWEMLEGRWTVARHDFTDVALNGINIPLDDIIIPSEGFCKVTAQSPTDPHYDAKLLNASVVHYRTHPDTVDKSSEPNEANKYGRSESKSIGSQGEKYAFQRSNGTWSLWDVGRGHNPTSHKVVDLRLKKFQEGKIGRYHAYEVVLDAWWKDGFGSNFFQMNFVKGKALAWELRCRFDDDLTQTMRQWMDIYTRVEPSPSDTRSATRSATRSGTRSGTRSNTPSVTRIDGNTKRMSRKETEYW